MLWSGQNGGLSQRCHYYGTQPLRKPLDKSNGQKKQANTAIKCSLPSWGELSWRFCTLLPSNLTFGNPEGHLRAAQIPCDTSMWKGVILIPCATLRCYSSAGFGQIQSSVAPKYLISTWMIPHILKWCLFVNWQPVNWGWALSQVVSYYPLVLFSHLKHIDMT